MTRHEKCDLNVKQYLALTQLQENISAAAHAIVLYIHLVISITPAHLPKHTLSWHSFKNITGVR